MFILAGVIPASAIANKKVKVPIQDFNRGMAINRSSVTIIATVASS